MRAHPAGPLHGNIAQPTAAGAPPEELGALDPHVWPRSARADRRRAAPRRPAGHRAGPHPRHPAVRARRGRLPRPGRGLRRRVRATPTCTTRRRRSSAARWPAGSPTTACTSTPAAATSCPWRWPPASRRSGSRCTATTSPSSSSQLAVDAGIGHVVVDSFDEIDRLLPLAAARVAAGGTPVPGADPGHRRHRGAHPRVHRHRPRGPEVRLLAGHRRRADRRRPGDPRAGAAADRAAQPHRLADLRHRRLRGRRPPRGRAARPGAPGDRRGARRAQPRRRLRHRLPVRGRPGEPARRRRQAARRHRRRVRPARACRCRGWPSSRAARSPGPAP